MLRVIASLSLLLLTACSNLPPAIKDAPQGDLQMADVKGGLTEYQGRAVRWGGQIVSVSNDAQGAVIEMVQFPLNGFGRPMLDRHSEGRFLAKTTEFIDPEIYKADSMLTIAGKLVGQTEKMIDKKTLKLPVVEVSLMHRWLPLDQRPVMPPDYYYWGPYPYGYDPWYDPFWRSQWGYPYYRY